MADERPPRASATDYRLARIGAAFALIGVLSFLSVMDAASPEYELSGVTLTAFLFSILTLLGLEALNLLRGR